MKQGWVITKLGEVSDIINGGTPKTNISEYWDGEIHWITPADLGKLTKPTVEDTPRKITALGLEKSSAKLFQENSIILSTRAPIGYLAINNVPMSTNQGCRGIVPSEKVDTWFLYYFLKKNVDLLESLGTGATFKELSTKALAGIEIPIPPLPEQQRIVSILDQVFAAIDKAKANAEQNLKNAKELFESYLQGVFEKKGDGWEEKRLGEIIDFLNGYAFKSKDAVSLSNTQLLRMGNLYQNQLNLERSPVFYPDDYINSFDRFVLKENDLVLSLTGTTGKEDYGFTVKIPKTSKKLLLNQRLSKITIKDERKINNSFLFYFLLSRVFLDEMYKSSNGTRQANLSTEILKELRFHFPVSISEQQRIVQKLENLSVETKRLEAIYQQKINNLEELKKSILDKALKGEL